MLKAKYSVGQRFLAPVQGEVRVIAVNAQVIDPSYPSVTEFVYTLEVTSDIACENAYFKVFHNNIYYRSERCIDYSSETSNMYLPMVREYLSVNERDIEIESVGWDHNRIPNAFKVMINGEVTYAWTDDGLFNSIPHAK